MFPWNLMTKDANGYMLAPRWLVVAVPLVTGAASWGATYATFVASTEQRLSALEKVDQTREHVNERLARIEAILEELMRRK